MQDMQDLDSLMRDKLDTHCREQLSAMLDGELAPDEARFLLRRLQHDRELGGCWERWQLGGDLMRGSTAALLPGDFAERVQAALSNDADAAQAQARVATQGRGRWLPWAGSAALAASVAAVALLAGPGTNRLPGQDQAPTERVASAPASTEPASQSEALAGNPDQAGGPELPILDPDGQGPAGDVAGALAATTAIAAVAAPTRRDASRRSEQRRAAMQPAPAVSQPLTQADASSLLAAIEPAAGEGGSVEESPIAVEHPLLAEVQAQPQARPWPRSTLPGFSSDGAFTAGLQATRPSYDAFEPRLPPQDIALQADAAAQAAETPTP